jgi:uncharacterized membrane protein
VEAAEILLTATRWLHSLATVVWVGAILFELLVLRPALGKALSAQSLAQIDASGREIVQASLIVFLMTGMLLTFDRLSRVGADASYVALLGLKVVLAIGMFQLGFRLRGADGRRRELGLRWLAGLGLAIIFLASLLKSIFERGLVR